MDLGTPNKPLSDALRSHLGKFWLTPAGQKRYHSCLASKACLGVPRGMFFETLEKCEQNPSSKLIKCQPINLRLVNECFWKKKRFFVQKCFLTIEKCFHLDLM